VDEARDLRAVLVRRGCTEERRSGSHLIVRYAACRTVVPVHTGDIPIGPLRSIVRDLTPCLGSDWLTREGNRLK